MHDPKPICDVAIVGGGVIGLACAWRLGQRGAQVVVLEGATCGAGATGASLGALWPASPLVRGPLQETQRKSLWSYPAFGQEIYAATGIDIGYRRKGRIELIGDAKHLAKARQEVQAAAELWPPLPGGPPMEVLTDQQIGDLEPAVAAGAWGGQWCRASAQVEVDKLMAGLRAACVHAGVVVREQASVTSFGCVGERVVAVECGRDILAAGRVLVATGAWTAQLHPALAAVAPIKPVRGQALMLETDRPVIERIVKQGRVYLVPWGNRILVGSTTEPEAGYDCRTTPQGIDLLLTGARAIVPALRDARILKAWAGLRPDGPKHKPVVGPVPGFANLFVAAGHFKIGVGMAPETSRVVAEMLLA